MALAKTLPSSKVKKNFEGGGLHPLLKPRGSGRAGIAKSADRLAFVRNALFFSVTEGDDAYNFFTLLQLTAAFPFTVGNSYPAGVQPELLCL